MQSAAVCAFGLGPFISFFDTHFSKKLVEKERIGRNGHVPVFG